MAGTLVPSFTFGPTGFVAPLGPAILTGVQGDINAAFGNALNFNLNTPQGQLATSEAAIISNTYAMFQYYAQQIDPAYSSGRMQDAIGRIYFLQRNASQPTALQVSCTGAQGVVIPVGALIRDTAGNLYQCTQAGTIPAAGSITLPFNCTLPGPTTVPTVNAIQIYQTINGWDSVAVVSGIVGKNVEGRAAFEFRRQDSVSGNSFGPIGAIIGAVSKVLNVADYWGYNNTTASPVTISGVTIPANAIYISVAGGLDADVAMAIWTKKGAGCPMAGNTTVTVFDTNPLYATPLPYSITFKRPTPIQLLFAVVLVTNPLIPSNAAAQIQAALIAATTGQSSIVPSPPKARIGTTVYSANYVGALTALGSWVQISSFLIGSINSNPAVFIGGIAGNTLTVASVTSGTIAIGQALFDADNRITNGTYIIAGSGLSWTLNQPGAVGATFTGTGSGTNLTVSAVTGVIGLDDVVTGTGVPANTTIVSQTSGTPGGAGVYVTNNATTSSGAALTTNGVITSAGATSTNTPVLASQVPQITALNILVSTT